MDYHGIDCKGYFKIETVPTLPTWVADDERRIIYVEDEDLLYYADDNRWVVLSGSYVLEFVEGDLASRVLTVTHNLSTRWVQVQVFDNNGALVNPDGITLTERNICTIDFTSLPALTGTWRVIVSK